MIEIENREGRVLKTEEDVVLLDDLHEEDRLLASVTVDGNTEQWIHKLHPSKQAPIKPVNKVCLNFSVLLEICIRYILANDTQANLDQPKASVSNQTSPSESFPPHLPTLQSFFSQQWIYWLHWQMQVIVLSQ